MQQLHVAAAAIFNPAGEVLVALRPDHLHQGGLWEFPGGKVEPGEHVQQALVRELEEELSIRPLVSRPLIRVPYAYPDRRVLLDVWRVDRFRGTPHGREGQAVAWVAPEDLPRRAFPAANLPIITAVRLPAIYLITGGPADSPTEFLRKLEANLAAGVRLVQLRAKGLADGPLRLLAREALARCRDHGARLLVNGDPALAVATGADGVHLDTARLGSLRQRPLPASSWVAASCHDRAELEHAQAIGVDFAVVSPVLPTRSHPGARTLGWDGLRILTEAATIPIYALGGMVPAQLGRACTHGAQGIAAISALWDAPDPQAVLRAAADVGPQ